MTLYFAGGEGLDSGPRPSLKITIGIPRLHDVAFEYADDPRLRIEFSRVLTPFEAEWLARQSEPLLAALENEGDSWFLSLVEALEGQEPSRLGERLHEAVTRIERNGAEIEALALQSLEELQGVVVRINEQLAAFETERGH